MGYHPDWIERQLAHAEHLADRAKMMQHWADLLDAWKAGDDGKVVPLHRAVA